MTTITIEMSIIDDTAQEIVKALDAIADRLSDVGYEDSVFEHLHAEDDTKVDYRIIRGYVKDRG